MVSQECVDIGILKYVFKEYNKTTKYRDIYFELVDNAAKSGISDNAVHILDKWLWKYGQYTVHQFLNIV